MDNYDKYIYATSFNEYEDDKLTECFEQFINDEDFRVEALCIINKNHPEYMLECHINGSNPEEGSLFEDTILDMAKEQVNESRDM